MASLVVNLPITKIFFFMLKIIKNFINKKEADINRLKKNSSSSCFKKKFLKIYVMEQNNTLNKKYVR